MTILLGWLRRTAAAPSRRAAPRDHRESMDNSAPEVVNRSFHFSGADRTTSELNNDGRATRGKIASGAPIAAKARQHAGHGCERSAPVWRPPPFVAAVQGTTHSVQWLHSGGSNALPEFEAPRSPFMGKGGTFWATLDEGGVNFALLSERASGVELCLFGDKIGACFRDTHSPSPPPRSAPVLHPPMTTPSRLQGRPD